MSNSDKWYRFFRPLFKIILHLRYHVVIVGKENIPSEGAAILAINHLKLEDSLLVAALTTKRLVRFVAKVEYFNRTFIAKEGLFKKIPLLHWLVTKLVAWFIKAVGMVPIDRSSREAMIQLETGAKPILASGNLFAIHPEGTRSKTGVLGRFKSGVAKLAHSTNALIIPIGIDYGEKRPYHRRPVSIIIGEPIDVTVHSGRNFMEVANYVRDIVSKLRTRKK